MAFTRTISNMEALKDSLSTNAYLQKLMSEAKTGNMFLAFRNDNATFYYRGRQACHLIGGTESFTPPQSFQ